MSLNPADLEQCREDDRVAFTGVTAILIGIVLLGLLLGAVGVATAISAFG